MTSRRHFASGLLVAALSVTSYAADPAGQPKPTNSGSGVTGGQIYTIPTNEQAAGPGAAKVESDSAASGKAMSATVTIDPAKVIGHISPMLYGACFEDLNHEVYGGLYAQMIFGESFEEGPETGMPHGWSVEPGLNRRPMFAGDWAMVDGTLWETAYRDYHLIRDGLSFQDGTVECELWHDKYDVDRFVGVGVRVNPKDLRGGAYRVRFSGIAHEVSLWRGDGQRVGVTRVDVGLDQWIKVKLEAKGGELSVYVADSAKPSIKYTDPNPLPAGSISCETDACRGMFKGLTVTQGDQKWTADFNAPNPHGTVSCWWDQILSGDGEFKWDADNPFNTQRSQQITLRSEGIAGVANKGLGRWGMNFTQGMKYTGRLYLRGKTGGPVTVALQSGDGSATFARQELTGITDEWKRFDFALTSDHNEKDGRFAVLIDKPGTIWVDQVVMMPTGDGLYKNLPVRGDMARLIVDSGVRAIRYGGDNSGAIGFPWKNQMGDPDKRPQYNCPWYAFDSRGWGIIEFVAFCQASGIEAIPCLSHHETAQDAADLVEFCNGPADSKWGKVRVSMGYDKPLGLHYVQYGNGFVGPEKTADLADAIHKVDPNVHILGGSIGHVPVVLPKPNVLKKWGELVNNKIVGYAMFPYVGAWGDGPQFEKMIEQCRADSGDIKVYCQEVNGGIHNLQRGLADAQFNWVCERHADDLAAVTYCGLVEADAFPDNGWEQGRIFFDNSKCWLQPAGWVGKMASQSALPLGVDCVTNGPMKNEKAYGKPAPTYANVPMLCVTACRDEATSKMSIKVVNLADAPIAADFDIKGIAAIPESAEVATLAGNDLKASNTPQKPNILTPKTEQAKLSPKFSHTFPAFSYTVFGPFTVSK